MTQRNCLKLSLMVLHHDDVQSCVFNWTTGRVSVAPRALPKIAWYLRRPLSNICYCKGVRAFLLSFRSGLSAKGSSRV